MKLIKIVRGGALLRAGALGDLLRVKSMGVRQSRSVDASEEVPTGMARTLSEHKDWGKEDIEDLTKSGIAEAVASLSDEHFLEDDQGNPYPPDAGLPGEKHVLSFALVQHVVSQRHPRKRNKDDILVKFSVREPFGWHTPTLAKGIEGWAINFYLFGFGFLLAAAACGVSKDPSSAAICCLCGSLCVVLGVLMTSLIYLAEHGRKDDKTKREDIASNPLYAFGPGLVLYFKMQKFLAALFFGLGLLALPACIVFMSGADGVELTGLAKLSVTTLGSFGGVGRLCTSGNASVGSSMVLECQTSHNVPHLADFEFYLGSPMGGCGCPEELAPGSALCPGNMFRGSEPTLGQVCCHNSGSLADRWPHYPTTRNSSCRLNERCFTGDPAATPPPTSGCAATILTKLCAGKKRCVVEFDERVELSNGTHAKRLSLRDLLECDAHPAAAADARFVAIAKCRAPSVVVLGKSVDKSSIMVVLASLDLLVCLVFFLATGWLARQEEREVRDCSQNSVGMSHYSLWLTNLPPHEDTDGDDGLERKLVEHLNCMLNEDGAKGLARTRRGQEAADVECRVVPVVHFGFDNTELLHLQRQRANCVEMLDREVHKLKHLKTVKDTIEAASCSTTASNLTKSRLAKAKVNVVHSLRRTHTLSRKKLSINGALLAEINRLDRHPDTDEVCLNAQSAFLTFSSQEAKIRCIELYGLRSYVCAGLVQGPSLRMGRTPLCFRQAPAPSNIVWENLTVPLWRQLFLSSKVTLLTLVALCLSFGGIWFAKTAYEDEKRNYPVALCPATRPTFADVELAAADRMKRGQVQCFCKQMLSGDSNLFLGMQFSVAGSSEPRYLCKEWFDTQVYLWSLMCASILGVLVVNVLLSDLMEKLVAMRRNYSRTGELCSVAKRVFLTQFMNTALVSLAVNGNLSQVVDGRTPLSGPHEDLSAEWYRQVGSSLLFTMVINCVAPHVRYVVIPFCLRSYRIWKDRGGFQYGGGVRHLSSITHKLTQQSFQKLHLGPRFRLAARYGQALNVVFVTITFCGAIPALLLVASVNFAGIYIVDKAAFLKFFKKPPQYDESLGLLFTSVVQYALLGHFMISLWAYSSPDILQQGPALVDTSAPRQYYVLDRILQSNTAVYILLVGALVVVTLVFMEAVVWKNYHWIRRKVLGTEAVVSTHHPLPDLYDVLTKTGIDCLLAELQQEVRHPLRSGMAGSKRQGQGRSYDEVVASTVDILEKKLARPEDLPKSGGTKTHLTGIPYNMKMNPDYHFVVNDNIDELKQQLLVKRSASRMLHCCPCTRPDRHTHPPARHAPVVI